MARYSVNLWGSDPRENSDDCWDGQDFDDLASAKRAFEDPESHLHAGNLRSSTHLEMCEVSLHDGKEYADVLEIKQIKTDAEIARMKREDDDSDWTREIAMQAGMGCGINAYNEVMGY